MLDAQVKIVEIERRLFTELRTAIAAEARRIRQTALALAEVDVLGSLAHIAALRNYCRPQFARSGELETGELEGGEVEIKAGEFEIMEGRHHVIEQQDYGGASDRFLPNDLH